jgi:hypothetical protein
MLAAKVAMVLDKTRYDIVHFNPHPAGLQGPQVASEIEKSTDEVALAAFSQDPSF